MANVPESFWRLASASTVVAKAKWAYYQTTEKGRKTTIISVDADEALVIKWAVAEYIERHRREYDNGR